MSNPVHRARLFLDHLAGTVELATALSVLREIITLPDQALGLTDEQLRFRLLALAARVPHPSSPAAPRSADWQPPESASGDRSAPIQLPPRPRLAPGRTEDFRFLVAGRFHRRSVSIRQEG